MTTTPPLAGRRIVITGAAGGIGLATAELFASSGAALALLDRDAAGVEALARRLGVFGATCDVSNSGDVERAVAEAETALGGLDGLINAAGLLRQSSFEDMPLEEWQTILDVNLTGTMLMCRSIIPSLRRAGSGTIVNIASIAALKPPPMASAYAVSKAGVKMLSQCLALELGPTIRVNSVCPGSIGTEMIAHLTGDKEVRDRLAGSAAANRIGTPEEIAQAMLYLTSDQSSFVSGDSLVVDGGVVYR